MEKKTTSLTSSVELVFSASLTLVDGFFTTVLTDFMYILIYKPNCGVIDHTNC